MVIIFGTGDVSDLAHFYLKDTYNVVAFCLDDAYVKESTHNKVPVVPMSDLNKLPPSKCHFLCPLYNNALRYQKYCQLKHKGYDFISYYHPSCSISSSLGENCFLMEQNVIQPFVKIGNNLLMWTQNHIGHHSTIGDNVFFASGVTVCGHVTVENDSWFGANSCVKDGLIVGENSIIGMGAVVVKDTTEGTWVGLPAKKQSAI